MLEGVEKNDYEEFKTKLAAASKDIEKNQKLYKPSKDIECFYSDSTKRMFISERIDITQRFEKCPVIDKHVLKYTTELEKKLSEVIAYTEVPLECRFTRVRT